MTDEQGPVAVQQPPVPDQPLPSPPVQQAAPVAANPYDDPALAGFHKIAAERRARVGEQPYTVPFGAGTIRVHRSMPANFAFDAAAIDVDPYAAKRLIRNSIIEDDQKRYDEILAMPPSNPEGIDGEFLVSFAEQLVEMYTGRPLGVQSR